MEFLRALIGQDPNILHKYRRLHRRWQDVMYAILWTRSYKDGLDFVERCDGLNSYFWDSKRIHYEEYERWDWDDCELRLQLYDRLDWWENYLSYFAYLQHEHPYLQENERQKHVFLSMHTERWIINQRKIRRKQSGRTPKWDLHHSQSELTDAEIQRRFIEALTARGLWMWVGL